MEFPENLYFNINSALDTYEVWKLGQNILVHLYDEDATGWTDEWRYYEIDEIPTGSGMMWTLMDYVQLDEDAGIGKPFYKDAGTTILDYPFGPIIWLYYDGIYSEGPAGTKMIRGHECTCFYNPDRIPNAPNSYDHCYVDLESGIVYEEYAGDDSLIYSLGLWDESITEFPFPIVKNGYLTDVPSRI